MSSRASGDCSKLLLACGNPLRGDDGVGSCIGEGFEGEPGIQVVLRQEFTPELAEALRDAETVVFVDASTTIAAGQVSVERLEPTGEIEGPFSHHRTPTALLRLTGELYGVRPLRAFSVTIGGGCYGLGDPLSEPVQRGIPKAIRAIRAIFEGTARDKP